MFAHACWAAAMAPDAVRVVPYESDSAPNVFDKGDIKDVFCAVIESGKLQPIGGEVQKAADWMMGNDEVFLTAYAPPEGFEYDASILEGLDAAEKGMAVAPFRTSTGVCFTSKDPEVAFYQLLNCSTSNSDGPERRQLLVRCHERAIMRADPDPIATAVAEAMDKMAKRCQSDDSDSDEYEPYEKLVEEDEGTPSSPLDATGVVSVTSSGDKRKQPECDADEPQPKRSKPSEEPLLKKIRRVPKPPAPGDVPSHPPVRSTESVGSAPRYDDLTADACVGMESLQPFTLGGRAFLLGMGDHDGGIGREATEAYATKNEAAILEALANFDAVKEDYAQIDAKYLTPIYAIVSPASRNILGFNRGRGEDSESYIQLLKDDKPRSEFDIDVTVCHELAHKNVTNHTDWHFHATTEAIRRQVMPLTHARHLEEFKAAHGGL
jgi:hypothetical protein